MNEDGFHIPTIYRNESRIERLEKRLNAIVGLFTYTLTDKAEDNENMKGSIPSYWPKCPKCNQGYYVDHCIFEPKILLCTECKTHFIGNKVI